LNRETISPPPHWFLVWPQVGEKVLNQPDFRLLSRGGGVFFLSPNQSVGVPINNSLPAGPVLHTFETFLAAKNCMISFAKFYHTTF
jgi:hypothetical protein